MTSGGNDFNDFREIVPTIQVTTEVEKTSCSRPWPWAYFLNGPSAAASIAPALIRHCLSCHDAATVIVNVTWRPLPNPTAL